ncbi:hypothetical protein DUI87_09733 [Hirundo rustica rustica]|uniref:Uncharacterized protein n=1 Tax=Hirundo rustica rustica TaxID=333673 RepID=A0A3M0KGC0_HIRRU|nr:hypothetical protein DUI87_09733 [Hirundo rustica rustica]
MQSGRTGSGEMCSDVPDGKCCKDKHNGMGVIVSKGAVALEACARAVPVRIQNSAQKWGTQEPPGLSVDCFWGVKKPWETKNCLLPIGPELPEEELPG